MVATKKSTASEAGQTGSRALLLTLQLDALRHDYVEAKRAPILAGLSDSGLTGDLMPPFGFEPDYAFFAGLYPDEADAGAQFTHAPATSPFGAARWIPQWCRRLPRLPDKVLRKGLRWLARRRTNSPFVTPAMIPYELLPYFDVAVPHQLDGPGIWQSPTVFDLLRQAGERWVVHLSPEHRVDVGAAVQHAQRELHPPLRFAFFHIVNLDGVGHRYGPDSDERNKEISRVDEGVRVICSLAASRFQEVHVLVFGDHGMAAVRRNLDVQSLLGRLASRYMTDYLVFLDSTMARFWFSTVQARAEVRAALETEKGGHWLTAEERNRYHLNYRDNRFGDELFIADPGVVILPNYHQASAGVLGMHGYIPECREQQSHFSLNSPRVRVARRLREPQDMRRIFPTMLDLLSLPCPAQCTVKSFLAEEIAVASRPAA